MYKYMYMNAMQGGFQTARRLDKNLTDRGRD
jgi:hypothetical protein